VGAEKQALGHKGLRQLSAAVSLALGLPEEFILERAAATGDAKWTPPRDDRPRRKSARRTINGWLKDPDPTVEYVAPEAFRDRDSQVMQEASYKFGAVGEWLPVDPRPVIFSDENVGLGDLQLVLQYTKQIVATRHMQISGRWVYRDLQDGNWTNYSPRPRMTPDEYCDLLERKISLLTVRIIAEAMVAGEANRKRVVAEWLGLHGATEHLDPNDLDPETIEIMADESRERREGPRPGRGDAWKRWRTEYDPASPTHTAHTRHRATYSYRKVRNQVGSEMPIAMVEQLVERIEFAADVREAMSTDRWASPGRALKPRSWRGENDRGPTLSTTGPPPLLAVNSEIMWYETRRHLPIDTSPDPRASGPWEYMPTTCWLPADRDAAHEEHQRLCRCHDMAKPKPA
jgi:hypothetical protein